jgi:hypothetical protein
MDILGQASIKLFRGRPLSLVFFFFLVIFTKYCKVFSLYPLSLLLTTKALYTVLCRLFLKAEVLDKPSAIIISNAPLQTAFF